MPEMDGYEATKRIREIESATDRNLIVALTAHAMSEEHERCLSAGMDAVLTKPIQSADLLKIAAAAAKRKQFVAV